MIIAPLPPGPLRRSDAFNETLLCYYFKVITTYLNQINQVEKLGVHKFKETHHSVS